MLTQSKFDSIHKEKEKIGMADISKESRLTYLQRRKKDILSCKEAVFAQNWEVLERIGHKIKGNAETFGFSSLTPIGTAMETEALVKNKETLLNLIAQLEKEVGALSVEVEAEY